MKLNHSTFYGDYELNLYKSHYLEKFGGGIAIQATVIEDGFEEPWSMITVNLGELPENCACIDTNNNGESILFELMEEGYCTLIGYKQSGFCTYPVVEFTKEFLDQLEEVK